MKEIKIFIVCGVLLIIFLIVMGTSVRSYENSKQQEIEKLDQEMRQIEEEIKMIDEIIKQLEEIEQQENKFQST